MCKRPVLAHQRRVALGFHRRAIERMVCGDDLALPSDVAMFDRHAQHQALEHAARGREIVEIVGRQRRDVEAVLWLGLHEALLGQRVRPSRTTLVLQS